MKIFFKKIFASIIFISMAEIISAQKNSGAEAFLDFMKANPGKASLKIIRNDSAIISFNAARMLPLASTMKIIIAIEYAAQVSEGLQDPSELIKVSDLDKYYVPNTDGGAHPKWKNFLQSKNIDIANGIPMKEVVNGMIIFSSNANTEFLMDKLGLKKINERWKTLGMHHTKIYPIVAALFLSNEFPNLHGDSLLQKLQSLTDDDYTAYCNKIHIQLKDDSSGGFKKNLPALPMDIQKIWSNRLPASDAESYAGLMQRIVSRKFFAEKIQLQLDSILQWPMELNPANKTVYKQLGMKGGSTAFILTIAAFAEDLQGNKTALCFLSNGLDDEQQQVLQQNLNRFLIKVINDEGYRNELIQQLK